MDINLIGYLGGFFITISFIPQVIKSYKTKKVSDLALSTLLFSIIGTIFWLAYGLLASSLPLIITNLLFGGIILFELGLKVKYDKKKR